MTNKEIGELRRRMKPDRTNLTAVYGCYVASSGEVLSTFREPFGLMAEEDKEKYLAIFRRALSGTPDRNLLDLSFSTKQVADSDEHRLLMRLRETALDDEQARQQEHETKMAQMPETLEALKKENEMLKQCLLEMSETVYA